MIPSELHGIFDKFYADHKQQYNFSTNEGCGKYTEDAVKNAQDMGYSKVGHLKKNPGQTQYNGHANDAFLYNEPASETNDLLQAVDIIYAAEAKPPYTPSNPAPDKNFGIDEPRYTEEDWSYEPQGEGGENDHSVPWVVYDERGFENLKQTLAHDYARRPQGADFDVSVWAARVFHSCYMGPDGIPLGMDAAMHKHKPEWCAALGIPVDNYYGE
jgi:hypothetical protein